MEQEDHEDTVPVNDPLVDDISTKVVIKIQELYALDVETHAERCIADAEVAARKAQYIAQKAASAFGECAEKLKRARFGLKS